MLPAHAAVVSVSPADEHSQRLHATVMVELAGGGFKWNPDLTLVVGVGEVGGALAEVLERGHRVARLDLKPATIDEPVR